MRYIITIICLSVALPSYAAAASNKVVYELTERCAKSAQTYFDRFKDEQYCIDKKDKVLP